MPLGIVSDSEFEIELGRLNPQNQPVEQDDIEDILPDSAEIISIKRQGERGEEVPQSVRKLVSEEALNGASSRELTRLFDVPASSITAYKNGRTAPSKDTDDNLDLKAHADKTRNRIVRKANNRILAALNSLTPEKLADEKAKDLSSIAKDMSAVIKNLTPESNNPGESVNKVQFVLYAPQVREEKHYNVIEVTE